MEEAIEPTALGFAEATADFISGVWFILQLLRLFAFCNRLLTSLYAGGIAGMAGVLAGAPLDVVRIRQQQPDNGFARKSILHLLRDTIKNEGGFRALFRGMASPMSTAAVQNAVCFHAYGTACRQLATLQSSGPASLNIVEGPQDGSVPQSLTLQNVFRAGCAAGAIQTAIVTPVDLIKIRLQLQTSSLTSRSHVGPLTMLQRVVATEGGLRSLYRGTGITLIRDVPSHGVYFAAFEWARELLEPGCREPGKKSESAAAVWAAGGLAGVLSWFAVYPFDVVKSRIQATSAASSRYSGWVDCAMQSWREEGSSVFVRGLHATLFRAFLVNGAIFTAYEASHELLKGS